MQSEIEKAMIKDVLSAFRVSRLLTHCVRLLDETSPPVLLMCSNNYCFYFSILAVCLETLEMRDNENVGKENDLSRNQEL